MAQTGQAAILNCSTMWKKMKKSFKTSEFKAQVHSRKEAWKREAMAVSAEKKPTFFVENTLK